MLQTLNQQPSGKNVAPDSTCRMRGPAQWGARPRRLPGGWTYGRAMRAGKRVLRRDKPGGQSLQTSVELNFLCTVIRCSRIDGTAQQCVVLTVPKGRMQNASRISMLPLLRCSASLARTAKGREAHIQRQRGSQGCCSNAGKAPPACIQGSSQGCNNAGQAPPKLNRAAPRPQ